MEIDYGEIPYWSSIMNEKQPETWDNMESLRYLQKHSFW